MQLVWTLLIALLAAQVAPALVQDEVPPPARPCDRQRSRQARLVVQQVRRLESCWSCAFFQHRGQMSVC